MGRKATNKNISSEIKFVVVPHFQEFMKDFNSMLIKQKEFQ